MVRFGGSVTLSFHDCDGRLAGLGPHVEKRPNARRGENDAAAVFVGFDDIIDTRGGQGGFERGGIREVFGDEDQLGLHAFEIVGIFFHENAGGRGNYLTDRSYQT
jgi:hypothetical protein